MLPEGSPSRLNDGAVDTGDRILVGTLRQSDGPDGQDGPRPAGPDRLTTLDADLPLSNGLAWSPDGTRLYSVDSTRANNNVVKSYLQRRKATVACRHRSAIGCPAFKEEGQ